MTDIFTPATEIEIAELISLLSGLPVAKDIVRRLATQRDMLTAERDALLKYWFQDADPEETEFAKRFSEYNAARRT